MTPAPRPADSSAATLVANALLLLARQDPDPAGKKEWTDGALRVSIPFLPSDRNSHGHIGGLRESGLC